MMMTTIPECPEHSHETAERLSLDTFGVRPSSQIRKRMAEQLEAGVLSSGLLEIIKTVRTCGIDAQFGDSIPKRLFRPSSERFIDLYIPSNPRQLSRKLVEVIQFLADTYLVELASTIHRELRLLQIDQVEGYERLARDLNYYGDMNDWFFEWLVGAVRLGGPSMAPNSPHWVRALYLFHRYPGYFASREVELNLYPRVENEIHQCTYAFPEQFVEAIGLTWEEKPDDRDAEIQHLQNLETWAWDAADWLKRTHLPN